MDTEEEQSDQVDKSKSDPPTTTDLTTEAAKDNDVIDAPAAMEEALNDVAEIDLSQITDVERAAADKLGVQLQETIDLLADHDPGAEAASEGAGEEEIVDFQEENDVAPPATDDVITADDDTVDNSAPAAAATEGDNEEKETDKTEEEDDVKGPLDAKANESGENQNKDQADTIQHDNKLEHDNENAVIEGEEENNLEVDEEGEYHDDGSVTVDDEEKRPQAAAGGDETHDDDITGDATTVDAATTVTQSQVVAEGDDSPTMDGVMDFYRVDEAAAAANPNSQATVKLYLMPLGQVITKSHKLSDSVIEIKRLFYTELQLSNVDVMFLFNGAAVRDEDTLFSLKVKPNSTAQFEVYSNDPKQKPLKFIRSTKEYIMPDVITVRIDQVTGESYDLVVEIERSKSKKRYYGGYRHKVTGIEYHHAGCQTGPPPRKPSNIPVNSRDTQTYQQKHIVQQTNEDTSTQMTNVGVYVANMTDKLLIPRPYETAEERLRKKELKVITIQKYWRRWLAKRIVARLLVDKRKREEWEIWQEEKKIREKEERVNLIAEKASQLSEFWKELKDNNKRNDFERRMNPKTKADFDLLYEYIERWKTEELQRIDEVYTNEAERKAALCQLLDQETQLLSSLHRHKLSADKSFESKKISQFLNLAASPKEWRGPDGKSTKMDTPFTVRARELKDIYETLTMKYLTQDERLDILLTVKQTVKEFSCHLTKEIIQLIDREADLLMRGIKDDNLDGLRKRTSTLFLQFIKTPTFNPEIARYLRVPQDPKVLTNNTYFCRSCQRYLPTNEFQCRASEKTVRVCRKCEKLDNDARLRLDYSYYKMILRELQECELEYNDGAQIAFLMQVADVKYLVDTIWEGHSALSAWSDLIDLALVRWDKRRPWSPWNTLLLTRDEAVSHGRIEVLLEGYGESFMVKVRSKHTLAGRYFSNLKGMRLESKPKSNAAHAGLLKS